MSVEQSALLRHLFSEITSVLEAAHALATEGQRPDLKRSRQHDIAVEIRDTIDVADSILGAISAIGADAARQTSNRKQRRRRTSQ